jgi:hypothetical protein
MLRVVDSATGKPIELAEVIVAGRATVRTSDSGVVSLRFLRPGVNRLTVRRVGYESKAVVVDAPSTDTAIVSVALRRVARELPTVTTEAAGDRKLEMMGFNERRKSSAAPRSAFITAEDLARWKPMLLTDVRFRTGRSISGCTTYLDGVQLAPARSAGNTLRRGIDALVQPSEVAAMEVYRESEVPPRFTPPSGGCVLLIWLK